LLRLAGSILAYSTNGLNCFGPVRDDLNNLSTDTSCDFGPPNPVNPRLGSFGLQGGVVPTVALLPNSPAINAVASGRGVVCPTTDARGVRRGSGCDIGAFEFTSTAVGVSAGLAGVRLEFSATPAAVCQLENSSDLQTWSFSAEGTCDATGRVVFLVPPAGGSGFFRLVTP
jgi:hypothetical protein